MKYRLSLRGSLDLKNKRNYVKMFIGYLERTTVAWRRASQRKPEGYWLESYREHKSHFLQKYSS